MHANHDDLAAIDSRARANIFADIEAALAMTPHINDDPQLVYFLARVGMLTGRHLSACEREAHKLKLRTADILADALLADAGDRALQAVRLICAGRFEAAARIIVALVDDLAVRLGGLPIKSQRLIADRLLIQLMSPE